MHTEYNKLVRDTIPDIIKKNGGEPTTHIADDEEYRKELYVKLAEEVAELTEKPSLDEAADVQEVLLAIYALEKWDATELESVRVAKAEKRGAFEKRIMLDSVEE